MAFELIYTSVEKGIKPGSKGFCTVAFTDGMPANYIQIAESLSAYRNLYPPHDVNYPKNPVAFSHLSFVVGGRELHFVTRVSAFGTDYSGRNNKLAHSIILRNSEFLEQGPVSVMQSGGFFRESWDEEPHLFRTEKRVTAAATLSSTQAKAWQQATGDAGWAGFLSQTYLDAPNRSAYLVFNPGMDVLPLIAEAVALMPPELRWKVTFNTYFISEVRGSTCAWRCVLPDSPLLSTVRRSGDTIIDLTAPLGKCNATGPLVEAARSGMQPDWSEYQKQLPTATTAVNAEDDDTYDAIPARNQATPAIATKHTRVKNVSLPSNARFTPPPPPVNKATAPWGPIAFVAAMIFIVLALLAMFGLPSCKIKPNVQQPAPNLPDTTNAHMKADGGATTVISDSTEEGIPGTKHDSREKGKDDSSHAGPPELPPDQVPKEPDSGESPSNNSHADNLKASNKQTFENSLKAIQDEYVTHAERIRKLSELKSNVTSRGDNFSGSILANIDKDLKFNKELLQKGILKFFKGDGPIEWGIYSVDGKMPGLKFYSASLESLYPEKNEKRNTNWDIVGAEYRRENSIFIVVTNHVKNFSVTGNDYSIIQATGDQFQHLILFNTNAGPLRPQQVQFRGNPGNWQIDVREILKQIFDTDGVSAKCSPIANPSKCYDVTLMPATNAIQGWFSYNINISKSVMDQFHEDLSEKQESAHHQPSPLKTEEDALATEWKKQWDPLLSTSGHSDSPPVKNGALKTFVGQLLKRQQNTNSDSGNIAEIFKEFENQMTEGGDKRKKENQKKTAFYRNIGSKNTLADLKELLDETRLTNDEVVALFDAVHKSEKTLEQIFMSTQPKTEKRTPTPSQPKNFTPITIKLFHNQSGMDNDLFVEISLKPPSYK